MGRDFATAVGTLYDQHEDILIQFGDTYEQLAEGNNDALVSASARFSVDGDSSASIMEDGESSGRGSDSHGAPSSYSGFEGSWVSVQD